MTLVEHVLQTITVCEFNLVTFLSVVAQMTLTRIMPTNEQRLLWYVVSYDTV